MRFHWFLGKHSPCLRIIRGFKMRLVRYNLVSYTLDGEKVKISRTARGDFTLSVPTDSSHSIVFSAVQQRAHKC